MTKNERKLVSAAKRLVNMVHGGGWYHEYPPKRRACYWSAAEWEINIKMAANELNAVIKSTERSK